MNFTPSFAIEFIDNSNNRIMAHGTGGVAPPIAKGDYFRIDDIDYKVTSIRCIVNQHSYMMQYWGERVK